ncbi:GNAT family acetyltransferase [Sinomonas notoginsengisoli]|uniref:GNAT family acetyltransferase n=1 Tax=Sinomonas notoginsengisoli TaxID=1457311 RepID=UPI001F29E460|nr:GNAT family acetyltransferase [Sinomonas notoginsengisoli]
MILRQFSEAERDIVIALSHAVGLTRPWNDPGKDIDRAMATWPDLFVVAESGLPDGGDRVHGEGVRGEEAAASKVVGTVMAGYDGHRGWVYYLAVVPERQGEGIGRALLAEAEARLTALGCPKIMLMVRRGNDGAHGFYTELGYREDEVVTYGKRLIGD